MATFSELARRVKAKYEIAGSDMKTTNVSGVHFYSVDEQIERCPMIYHSGIIIIVEGQKFGYLGGRTFTYNPQHYLALGLPLAMECEAHASPENPLSGLFIEVNPAIVSEVALAMGMDHTHAEADVLAVEAAPMSPEMSDAVARLLTHLCSDIESAVLGAGCVREIIYRALDGPAGFALKGLLRQDSHTLAVAKAMQAIHGDCAAQRSIDDMARAVGMSASSFHRAFRQVTDDTPLQYVKKVRLTQARALIVEEGYRVGAAAAAVGYESAAQFSRDFKTYFGITAVDAQRTGTPFARTA